MSRLPEVSEQDLDDEGRAFLARLNDGPRGARQGRIGMVGPYGVWARAPQIGEPTQQLGAALRFGSSLSETVKEVVICTVAAFNEARFVFAAHRRLGLQAGLNDAALEQLRQGQVPALEGDEAVAWSVTQALLEHHRVPEEQYRAALDAFGEQGLIELVTLAGYYTITSMTVNCFDVDLAPGMVDPFPDS